MSAEPFIGEISMFGGNFAPRDWAMCDGQILPISQHQALFSLLGTMYGGDGRTTFALPDLRGRAPIHQGSGPGLTPRRIGHRGGTESVSSGRPGAGQIGTDNTGKGVTTDNMMPYLAINYIISLRGIFPSRS
jgi:microcystin-dependent protein